jgi:hypothetical protein
MGTIAIIEGLFSLAQMIPKAVPLVKDLLAMLKGEPVTDITHEELVTRVDAAIAKLPVWE